MGRGSLQMALWIDFQKRPTLRSHQGRGRILQGVEKETAGRNLPESLHESLENLTGLEGTPEMG